MRSVGELLQQAARSIERRAFDDARRSCRLVLKAQPRQFDALHLLGVVALETGAYADAEKQLRAAVAVKPRSHQALLNLSIALCELGRGEAALAQCDAALREAGCDRPRALVLRATALAGLGRADEALAGYDQAIALAPRNPDAHFNRGNLLKSLERHDEALASYDAALALAPRHVAALNNRGAALRSLGRQPEAIACYRQALRIDPRSPDTHFNLGNALRAGGRHLEAIEHYSAALASRPDWVDALVNRGGTAFGARRYVEAIADYTRARRLQPDHRYVLSYIVGARTHLCDWSRASEEDDLRRAIAAGKGVSVPFNFTAICDSDAEMLANNRAWTGDHFPAVAAKPVSPPRRGRIRLAYVSPDFRNHAVAHVAAGLIETHDRTRFEVVGMALGPPANDDMRRRLEAAFDRFVDAETLTDAAAADLLRAQEIDIAIDLAGYTDGARTGIFARRPAPVQVAYLGFPGTMGADFIDYIVADRWTVPEASTALFTEKIVRLPDSYQVNDSKRQAPPPVLTRATAGLPPEGFVFCCFNNPAKIRPHVFDVWMRLLGQLPGSVLWLVAEGEARANLVKEAGRRGIPAERLVFAPRASLAEHLDRHRLADLFLDTLPYNAHATASDALRMHVPIVTCLGGSFAGRVGASLLNAVGLPELVTDSLAGYEALALRLAQSPDLLAATRRKLAGNVATHALYDTDRFCRHIEAAYTIMHERRCRGEPPDHVAVPSS